MMNEVLETIDKAFPVSPKPARFFTATYDPSLGLDIPTELQRRIAGRSWKDLSLLDWRMLGASLPAARRYFEPTTFLYYLPSILIGTLKDIQSIDLALEAMVPENKNKTPRGDWWHQFAMAASSSQRAALISFLSYIREDRWTDISSADQWLLERAEAIWNP